ncbi:MAG TPA: S-methyl-5'-thioadenosine phosphorylase [Kofleriaceae bacterium]|nr:S-methyl-5'-thioadenosine phosphorylase [Kofleriaceae bacterium]
MQVPRIGIIGGSGFGSLAALRDASRADVESGFGKPSSPVMIGRLFGADIAFLSRHGDDHRTAPARVNARANIDALKRVGCTQVLSLSAVGSLRKELPPGHFVLVDQFIDRTHGRPQTFFDDGVVAHVGFADPVCTRLRAAAAKACVDQGVPHASGGTYVVMNGPQFSTRAESALHRSWGASVIGMTALPEAKLAREAEMCFLTIAMPTDYDCWHDEHDAVTAAVVADVMRDNRSRALALLEAILPGLAGSQGACRYGCDRALDGAIMTTPRTVAENDDPRTRHLLSRWLRSQQAPRG